VASVLAWPALGWEEHDWRPTIPTELISRRVRQRHAGPYRAAVVPAIAEREVSLPAPIAAAADDASAEIARFDAELGAEVAPFGALLLRSESASSSQIENLTSGARAIALAELGQGDRSNASQIVANVRAMQAAIALADQLDGDAILAMHAALMERERHHEPGQWRREQVWVGGTNVGPHLADYVAPHHTHVPRLMDDLKAFIRRDDLPALVHAALAHAQFETVHPFTDGNGRTGRALIHAMLYAKGLTRNVTVPVSAGLLTDTDAYFSALTRYRRGDAGEIIRLMSEASFTAIANGRQLVADLNDIRSRWGGVIHARRDAAAWQLAELVLRQPVIDSATAERELGATSANTHRALRQLTDAGVITELSGRKRARLWQATEILSALDDFAARAGRRRLGDG
jgi:Fic family protein